LLVRPTWRKTFGLKLGTVWARALSAIEQADRIVIIGYSMPETDLHMKYLLAAGLMRNQRLSLISFVNPDKKLERRMREVFWGSTRPTVSPQLRFTRSRTAEYFFDPACIRGIGRDRSWFEARLRVTQGN
jgi:hypothetical protein